MVITTFYFWDCECKENYIHPDTEHYCARCGKYRNEQPESMLNEVIHWIADGFVHENKADRLVYAPIVASEICRVGMQMVNNKNLGKEWFIGL